VQEATNSHAPEYKTGHMVPGLRCEFERWVRMIPNRDWLALERGWAAGR